MNANNKFLYSEILLLILTASSWIWSGAPSHVWTLNYFTIFCAIFIVAELFVRKVDFGVRYLGFFYPYIIILLLVIYGYFFTDPYTQPQAVKVFFYFILTILYFIVAFASKRSWFFWLGTHLAVFYVLNNVDYISLETRRNVVIGDNKTDSINSNIFGFMCVISILDANFNLFVKNKVLLARALPKLLVKFYYLGITIVSSYAILFATGGSRKGLILLILVFGASTLFASKLRFDAARLISYSVGFILSVILMGVIVAISPFFSRMQEIFYALTGQAYEEASLDTRLLFIEEGLKIWLGSPIIGVWCKFFREWGTYAHSNYIDLLCNYGVVGLFAFYASYYIIMTKYVLPSFKQKISFEHKKQAFFLLVTFFILLLWEIACVTHSDRSFPPLMGALYSMSIVNFLNYRLLHYSYR